MMALYPPDNHGMSADGHIWNLPLLCSFAALILSFLGIIAVLSGHAHISFSLILIAVLIISPFALTLAEKQDKKTKSRLKYIFLFQG